MPTVTDLIGAMQAHLIAQGIGRSPSVAGSLPTIWKQPDGVAVAAGDKTGSEKANDLAISLMLGGGIPQAPYNQAIDAPTIDVWYRARQPRYAFDAAALVHKEIVGDISKRNWDMAGIQVLYSSEWSSLRPSNAYQGEGQGVSFSQSFIFEIWRP